MLKWLRRLNIRSKLIIILLIISSTSIAATAYIGYTSGRDAITNSIFNHLTSVRKLTASETSLYFATLEAHIQSLAEDLMVAEALTDFDSAYQQLSAQTPKTAQQPLIDYYRLSFLPQLAQASDSSPVLASYLPRTPVAQYLQSRYLVEGAGGAPVDSRETPIEDVQSQSTPEAQAALSITLDTPTFPPAEQASATEQEAETTISYDAAHARYHKSFNRIVQDFAYHDLFLINPQGKIIYTVAKEVDFATDIVQGPYSESGLARAFDAVRQEKGSQFVHIEDYSFYRPSHGRPAAFIATPIFSDSNLVGVLAVQLSTDVLQRIVTQDQTWETSGLGKTGEVLLVGEDLRLRAVSRPFIEDREGYLDALRSQNVDSRVLDRIEAHESPVLLQEASSEAVKRSLAGRDGVLTARNYLNKPALIAYAPLKLKGLNWGIVTEMALSEVYQPIYSFQRQILVTAVILSLLVTLMAMLMSGRFVSPIRRLMKGAQQVEAGDLTVDLRVRTGDEFEDMSVSLARVVRKLRDRTIQIQDIQTRNESLLFRFLPDGIVKRLKDKGLEDESWKIAEVVPNVSVILGRLSGYEQLMQQLEPQEVVATLDTLVQGVDAATERFGVEKLRTFGDSYLAVCGLSTPHLDHSRRAVEFAQEMRGVIRRFRAERGGNLQIQIAVASGTAVAGIIGEEKLTFDVYGQPITEMQLLNDCCPPDEIYVSRNIHERLKEFLAFDPVGKHDAWRVTPTEQEIATWRQPSPKKLAG